MKDILWILLEASVIFIAFIILRAIFFKPKNTIKPDEKEIEFDNEKAVENLRELVKCKTVSYRDSSLEDDFEFEKLKALLPTLYPNVFKTCEYTEFPDRALLFKWEGKYHNRPAVFMAHYDVVPVNDSAWEKPPFDAILEDGVIWGRGTLDTKVTFGSILFAAEHLISQKFVPEYDVYFAFSGGEEVNGKGAANIVDYFEELGITPAMILDEGGAVVENVFPGVNQPCGLVGIAEKGMMNVQFKAKSNGGHASAPTPGTPIDQLSKACRNVLEKPFKAHLTKPAALMFDTLGRHSTFLYKIIFANIHVFGWVIDLLCKKKGGELNALMRTTVAFTQAKGSEAANVIPPEAELTANIRLNPEDSMASTLAELLKKVDNEKVEINMLGGMNPSRISTIECDGWTRIATAITSTWEGTIVAPYLMVQCSDSRHYGRISDKVYRFSAMDLTSEERATIHGNNERIRVETLNRATEFYIRLMEKC